jgi:hypothetical protein
LSGGVDIVIKLPDKDIGFPGIKRLAPWSFANGNVVPMFEVLSVHALNYVVGYAKHLNRDECTIFSRGQGQLYDNLCPSLYRALSPTDDVAISNANAKLNAFIDSILLDKKFLTDLGFPLDASAPDVEVVEAMLQHYGVRTRMLDAVDNHWIALWFGLYEQADEPVGGKPYALYQKREVNAIDMAEAPVSPDRDLYQYILLIAASESGSEPIRTLDLRLSLPQRFMRPHAQHGVMLDYEGDPASNVLLDYSDSVVGIVRIRIDRAAKWTGSGHLISYENLFPSRAFDKGYSVLLDNSDRFAKEFGQTITYYVYDVE